MTANPSRRLEVWRSSRADAIKPISGAFVFKPIQTLMVRQTLDFIYESRTQILETIPAHSLVRPFFECASWYSPQNPTLIWQRNFASSDELFAFDLHVILNALRQLETHVDVNLLWSELSYLADVGSGPKLTLLTARRLPITRGMAFEVTERGRVKESLRIGDFVEATKPKVMLSQQHYSTGMALLSAEDVVGGLIDAAFMQFYLASECLLERHERNAALANGIDLYGTRFDDIVKAIVAHVYIARHRFYGHAHPKVVTGLFDPDHAFHVAKQVLVARYCARRLLAMEVNRDLVIREMRLYADDTSSIEFSGNLNELTTTFALPE